MNAPCHAASIVDVASEGIAEHIEEDNLEEEFDSQDEDDVLEAAENDDDDIDLEEEASKVEVGFNVAVMCDGVERGDPFFVILCDRVLYSNPETFVDDWGNTWSKGDMLVRGFYYSRISSGRRGPNVMYEILKDRPAYACSHHVICSDFLMLPTYAKKGLQRYGMSSEVRSVVLNALDCMSNIIS